MLDDAFASLAPAQRTGALSALATVLGSAPIDAIAPVGSGASGAWPFRVEAGGRNFLLRVEGTPSPLRNPHQYASMRIAADAGIAPRLHHVAEAARVAVMDFIEEQPLESFPGGVVALARALGQLLARVQATPPFARFVEYPVIVAALWAHVCGTGLFAPACSMHPPSIWPVCARATRSIRWVRCPATTIRCRATCCSTASVFG